LSAHSNINITPYKTYTATTGTEACSCTCRPSGIVAPAFYGPLTGNVIGNVTGNVTGNADTATKLSTSAGSTTQPVYFSSGKPVATTYTLGKSVPSDAMFTDTHHTAVNRVGASNTTTNAATSNNGTYLKVVENNTVRSALLIKGAGATTVSSDANGNITINSTDNNTTYTTATTTAGGLMSATDKSKLDGVASGATAVGKVGTNYNTAEVFNNYSENVASGQYSHAEGHKTQATANYAHAEGISTLAQGVQSHAEGYNTKAYSGGAHTEGYCTETHDSYSHAEGGSTKTYSTYAHAEGESTVAGTAYADRTDTYKTQGQCAHAEGGHTKATNDYSHSEGYYTTASGKHSHAEGSHSQAEGQNSHAEGASCAATKAASHAGGNSTSAEGAYSFTHGSSVVAQGFCHAVFGKYNTSKSGATGLDDTSGSIFTVGVGTSSATKNAFRIGNNGTCYGTAAFAAAGADYAEMFEWQDGNLDNEDRRGLFVVLDGEKIRLAQNNDDFILGIISANPSVVGDIADDEWFYKFKRDIFGAELFETIEIDEYFDEEIGETVPAHTENRRILNPDFDETQEYISRSERKEWATVGMLGKLVVIDDGTCEVNGYCAPGQNGIATKSEEKTKYRVMTRLDENHVKVLAMCM
jgi:hypothetical protein